MPASLRINAVMDFAAVRTESQREPLIKLTNLVLQRLPFSILIIGICAIVLLRGHVTKQLWVGSASSVIATVAFYRDRLWPSESYRTKLIWWAILATGEMAIILSMGKQALIVIGIAVVLTSVLLLIVILHRLFPMWFGRKP